MLRISMHNPNGAKVEDAPDLRRPKANAVCCCEAAAIYMRVFGNAGDGVSSAFPKGKQNGEKKELLYLIITVDINIV
jgi:hypothetical protein